MGPSKRTWPFSMKYARSRDGEGDVDGLLDEDDRRTALADLLDHGEQLLDDHRREPERQLVDHQQARLREERLGEGEHLLLATGEVAGVVVPALAQDREQVEHLVGRSTQVGRVALEQPARDAQVVLDGQTREHALAAWHLDDTLCRNLLRRRVGRVAAVEDDRPTRRGREPGDGAQQRRLARTVRAEQRDDLALVDLDVDAEQHLHAVVRDVEVLDHQQLRLPAPPRRERGGLRDGRAAHALDVVGDERTCRGKDERADEEDRDQHHERGADA